MTEKERLFAEVLLTRLSANKVACALNLPLYACRRLKTKVNKNIKPVKGKRFFSYGPKSRLLTLMYERSWPVLDVFLFTEFYPSDIIACLRKNLDLSI